MRYTFSQLSSIFFPGHRQCSYAHESQFTWARKADWSHFYSYSEEIWQYFKDVVDTFGLRKYMKLRHEIIGAEWDEKEGLWSVKVKDLLSGSIFVDKAEVFINGGGVLK